MCEEILSVSDGEGGGSRRLDPSLIGNDKIYLMGSKNMEMSR